MLVIKVNHIDIFWVFLGNFHKLTFQIPVQIYCWSYVLSTFLNTVAKGYRDKKIISPYFQFFFTKFRLGHIQRFFSYLLQSFLQQKHIHHLILSKTFVCINSITINHYQRSILKKSVKIAVLYEFGTRYKYIQR